MARKRVAAIAFVVFASVSCVSVSATRGPVSPDGALAAANALLAHGAAAWNAGDLDGFMNDYSVDATFVTSQGVMRGTAAIRERYAPRFRPGVARGTLSFEGVEAHVLGPDAIHVIAWYVLEGLPSGRQRGPTSLVLRRSGDAWRIVHDHSS